MGIHVQLQYPVFHDGLRLHDVLVPYTIRIRKLRPLLGKPPLPSHQEQTRTNWAIGGELAHQGEASVSTDRVNSATQHMRGAVRRKEVVRDVACTESSIDVAMW